MKYRIFTLLGLMALSAATLVQAQDYDDIYYDASSSKTTQGKTVKVEKPVKTIAVYGEVPETYKVTANSNYRIERDVDEYNRRGVGYEPDYELDINGDTIYEDAFANTRRIERFYNPDIVILSDDDELVELYYDESPSINLIIGSDAFLGSTYGWDWASSYYPWYSWGTYYPWSYGWYDPWYSHFRYGWYRPWFSPGYYGSIYWGWGYRPWFGSYWCGYYGWDNWHARPFNYADWGHRPRPDRVHGFSGGSNHRNVGLSPNRNGCHNMGGNRNGTTVRGDRPGSRNSAGVGSSSPRGRAGASGITRSGNMDKRSNSGVMSRNSSVSRSSNSGVSRSSGNYSGSRSSGSYSSGSRSSGSYSSGSRSSSSSSGSYNSGSRSSSSSSGSYSSGSRSSGGGGGGSHGGSSGGGGRRR